MTELALARPSAVAIIETPEYFLAEGRPDLPGKLAYSGMVQFFGGHAEEAPEATIRRELFEELDLQLEIPLPQVWHGKVLSQNRQRERVMREVSLFRILLDSEAGIRHKTPGTIERITKTAAGIDLYQHRLTAFSFKALHTALAYRPEQIWVPDALADIGAEGAEL